MTGSAQCVAPVKQTSRLSSSRSRDKGVSRGTPSIILSISFDILVESSCSEVRICVQWCKDEGITSIFDLKLRIVNHREYEELWYERCRLMQDGLKKKTLVTDCSRFTHHCVRPRTCYTQRGYLICNYVSL